MVLGRDTEADGEVDGGSGGPIGFFRYARCRREAKR